MIPTVFVLSKCLLVLPKRSRGKNKLFSRNTLMEVWNWPEAEISPLPIDMPLPWTTIQATQPNRSFNKRLSSPSVTVEEERFHVLGLKYIVNCSPHVCLTMLTFAQAATFNLHLSQINGTTPNMCDVKFTIVFTFNSLLVKIWTLKFFPFFFFI